VIDLVGREAEAAAIARFIDDIPRGPVGLLIEGEPGIGKTTVLSMGIQAARERGLRVLAARPAEAEAELSFAVLSDLIGAVVDEAADALPPPQRAALEITLLRRDAGEPADPRTTATALVTVLATLARRDPLLLAIDDEQWVDGASRRALGFAVRRLPPRAGIIVARRVGVGAAGAPDLERALDPGRVQRLAIGPLSVPALHALIRSRLGLTLARPVVVRIAEMSGGNPFYALEIAAAIARTDDPPGLGETLPVPGTLQELLHDRLERLSPSARAVASAAAALSRPSAEIVAAAVGSDDDVDAGIAEAESAGVLALDGDRLRFSHPLLASTIYASSTGVLRRTLHRRLAAVVADPEERARHLARSTSTADERIAAAIEAGAALAARRGAPEAAAELYDAAGRLTPDTGRDDRARRLVASGKALTVAGDLEGARSRGEQALELAGPGPVRAGALLLLGDLATYTDSIHSRIAYQERALAEAGENRALRVEILLALFEQIAVDPAGASRRADEALALLRGGEDRSSLSRALIGKFVAEVILGHGARPELLAEGLALEDLDEGSDTGVRRGAERVRTTRRGSPVSVYPLLWSHWIDDLAGARARYRLLRTWSEDHGDVVGAAELIEFVAMAEFRAGNWAEAERALEGACDTLSQFELRGPFIASFADRSVMDAHRGRIDRARRTLDQVLAVDGLDRLWSMVAHSAQGAVEFCAGDHEAAHRAWGRMRDEARAVGWVDNLEDRSEPDHVEALIALGELDEAGTVLEHLEWRGRTLPRRWIEVGLPRARGLMLAAEGRLADAIAVVEAAPATPSLPFDEARLLLVRGQLERRANRKLAARASLEEALRIFDALGSPPWAERARDEIARLGLRHRGPAELTETERRIAELAATGMTNRQVADAAFVSAKTVEANLGRVYRKLGIRSRAELGAWMAAESGRGAAQT
jgi:ATP/maltotriose-dependent transcriptional regulator MalT